MSPELHEVEELLDYTITLQNTYAIRSFTLHHINAALFNEYCIIIDTDTNSYDYYITQQLYDHICTTLSIKNKRVKPHLYTATSTATNDLIAELKKLSRSIKIKFVIES